MNDFIHQNTMHEEVIERQKERIRELETKLSFVTKQFVDAEADRLKCAQQIDKLANFIMAEVPGEPSQDQGAVDTAIRIMQTMEKRLSELLYLEREKNKKEAEDAK